jgi:hypothetical protein
MIELKKDGLRFSFSEVHRNATLTIDFQRTLRIPDDDKTYPLPPGLGRFPLRHVDDHVNRVPSRWIDRGGVLLPMYQSEALWIAFRSGSGYPMAVKVATGKINAVTGEPWTNELSPEPQDYVVVPDQPWLDGYAVEKGMIRQFVAMPLGSGYTAEEQLTGEAEHGGLQLIAYPMKREVYDRIIGRRARFERLFAASDDHAMERVASVACDMGLAPGGRMRQHIYEDEHGVDVWDTRCASRCFVHIANSLVWQDITGHRPPTTPPTARQYAEAGLPWFDYYDADRKALEGSGWLTTLKSVVDMGREKREVPVPENQSTKPRQVVRIRRGLKRDQVREGTF